MTTKPQAPEVAEVETQDLPNIDTAIAAEVAKQLKDERTALREDLEELHWLKQIEMAEAVIQLVGCMTQARADDAAPKPVQTPKATTEADLRAQRIKAERAKLLTKREGV